MSRGRISWDCLPPEIRNGIIGLLSVLGGRCSLLATVARDWQSIIEPLNFAEISLTDSWGLDKIDNKFIADAFESLFTSLSAWEARGDLVLDISVYSPRTTLINDPAHGWVAGKQVLAPEEFAIERTFDEIMSEGPFDDEEPEMQWWRGLPFVPVVGSTQPLTNQNTGNQTLIESFPGTKLCKLTIFENFNESYPERYSDCPAIRVPNPAVSRKLARASLHLTTLSASFMADAGHFFAARQDSWTWDKLTSLALTSRVLNNDADTSDTNNMLRDAAVTALKMPRLETMELWNGRRGVAMLFRSQRARDGQSAIITIRGTSELALGIAAEQARDVVAHRHCHGRVVVQTSLIDPDVIRCHGDAIRQLVFSTEVASDLRPP
ncbi:hypothetical protein UCREL1_7794 [Eutypa lata UCREL1]|uniref:DUF6546 domain-containing protein n=1 Tax=Eutypa lata (strain UCR-EL1) TaxID=1287681 RepID=M7SLH1_EUTLA|nr:hypothetical protein UCREL1_7794 [Eutypa lata UCREL1]